MTEPITAYPLCWPAGRPRAAYRTHSRFGNSRYGGSRHGTVSANRVRRDLLAEVDRMGGHDLIISSNVELRRDGLPFANHRAPSDPGVAVYFTRNKQQLCFACDQWETVDENLWAIVKTIDALRGIERWGSGDMMERAFTGFTALPSPEQWWHVLGFDDSRPTREDIEARFRELAMQNHPDRGGDHEAMARINWARDQGLEQVTA